MSNNNISEEYLQKFTLSDNSNPFINPKPRTDPPELYGHLYPTVFDPIKELENSPYTPPPQPSVVTYKKMKWNSKTSLNNPLRPFTVSGQQLSFTKNIMLPRRVTVMTNNVPKQAVTQECYTPVNNNVVVINN
jgi:hypothetical protein